MKSHSLSRSYYLAGCFKEGMALWPEHFENTYRLSEPVEDWNDSEAWADAYKNAICDSYRIHYDTHKSLRFLLRQLLKYSDIPLPRGQTVNFLDAGSGFTYVPHLLEKWGFHVTAIDLSKEVTLLSQYHTKQCIEQSFAQYIPTDKRYGSAANVESGAKRGGIDQWASKAGSLNYLVGDWLTVPLPKNNFNFIYCRNGLRRSQKHYWRASIIRFREILAPGGILLLENLNLIRTRREIFELFEEEGLVNLNLQNEDTMTFATNKKHVISGWPTG